MVQWYDEYPDWACSREDIDLHARGGPSRFVLLHWPQDDHRHDQNVATPLQRRARRDDHLELQRLRHRLALCSWTERGTSRQPMRVLHRRAQQRHPRARRRHTPSARRRASLTHFCRSASATDVLHPRGVATVATAHHKSAAQVALRWVTQQGVVAVAANKREHLQSICRSSCSLSSKRWSCSPRSRPTTLYSTATHAASCILTPTKSFSPPVTRVYGSARVGSQVGSRSRPRDIQSITPDRLPRLRSDVTGLRFWDLIHAFGKSFSFLGTSRNPTPSHFVSLNGGYCSSDLRASRWIMQPWNRPRASR